MRIDGPYPFPKVVLKIEVSRSCSLCTNPLQRDALYCGSVPNKTGCAYEIHLYKAQMRWHSRIPMERTKYPCCPVNSSVRQRWARRNIDKLKVIRNRYRANKLNAEGSHTEEEWLFIKEAFNSSCVTCKRKEPEIKLELDHIHPLSKGGSNYIENIQPLCRSCNASKNNKIFSYPQLSFAEFYKSAHTYLE